MDLKAVWSGATKKLHDKGEADLRAEPAETGAREF